MTNTVSNVSEHTRINNMVTKDNNESCYSQQAWSNNVKWEYIIIFTVTSVNNTVVIAVVLLL